MDERVIAIINLESIKNNILAIKSTLNNNVKIMSVLKANAYGHGAVEIAKYIEHYIDYAAVATLDEGIILRKNGIEIPILVLGEVAKKNLCKAKKYNLITTIFSKDILQKYINYARKYNKQITVHIAIDTGMNRIGIRYDDFDTINFAFSSKFLKINGLFSHLAKADDEKFTEFQNNNFKNVIEFLNKNKYEIPMCHIANSIASRVPKLNFDCVRIGISQFVPINSDNKFAMTLKAKIVQIKTIKAGEIVGYDCSFKAQSDTVIATLSIGYADGLMRALSNIGKVTVNGKIANITGKICMDYTMIDISKIDDVHVGDYVTIFGEDLITADTVADLAGTISYEVFTNISDRVKRIYIR